LVVASPATTKPAPPTPKTPTKQAAKSANTSKPKFDAEELKVKEERDRIARETLARIRGEAALPTSARPAAPALKPAPSPTTIARTGTDVTIKPKIDSEEARVQEERDRIAQETLARIRGEVALPTTTEPTTPACKTIVKQGPPKTPTSAAVTQAKSANRTSTPTTPTPKTIAGKLPPKSSPSVARTKAKPAARPATPKTPTKTTSKTAAQIALERVRAGAGLSTTQNVIEGPQTEAEKALARVRGAAGLSTEVTCMHGPVYVIIRAGKRVCKICGAAK